MKAIVTNQRIHQIQTLSLTVGNIKNHDNNKMQVHSRILCCTVLKRLFVKSFLNSYKSYFQSVIELIMCGSLVAVLLHYSQVATLHLVQCQCISDLAIWTTTQLIYLLWVQMLTLKNKNKNKSIKYTVFSYRHHSKKIPTDAGKRKPSPIRAHLRW